jgi:hypothetical protein
MPPSPPSPPPPSLPLPLPPLTHTHTHTHTRARACSLAHSLTRTPPPPPPPPPHARYPRGWQRAGFDDTSWRPAVAQPPLSLPTVAKTTQGLELSEQFPVQLVTTSPAACVSHFIYCSLYMVVRLHSWLPCPQCVDALNSFFAAMMAILIMLLLSCHKKAQQPGKRHHVSLIAPLSNKPSRHFKHQQVFFRLW